MRSSLVPAAGPISNTLPGTTSRSSLDAALIARIAKGDRNAMLVLFTGHQARVFRFILRMTGDKTIAEDLTSEVFLDVWRQAGQFEGRSTVSTWMLAMARYKALAARRRRCEDQLDEEVAEAIEDENDDPEVAVQKKDRSEILRRCLGKLSAESPADRRPRLLPREVCRRSRADPLHPGKHREDAAVPRAQAAFGAGQRSRFGPQLSVNALRQRSSVARSLPGAQRLGDFDHDRRADGIVAA